MPIFVDGRNWHVPPFSWISLEWEAVIAAGLLLLTLLFFPGGIAQQQEGMLRWLSFRRFHGEPEDPLSNPPPVRRLEPQ